MNIKPIDFINMEIEKLEEVMDLSVEERIGIEKYIYFRFFMQ